MIKVVCGVFGVAGRAFEVDIDENASLSTFKDMVKEKNKDDPILKFIASKNLDLVLTKKNNKWLTYADLVKGVEDISDFRQLDGPSAPLKFVGLSKEDVQFVVTKEDVEANMTPVHVLVVVSESIAKDFTAASTPVTIDQVEMILNKVLKEREEKMLSISISTCTRSKEGKLMASMGYTYSTVDVVEDTDDSIPPYVWHANIAEDHLEQHTGYMQYFRDNLQGVLNQDGNLSRFSTRTNPKYYLKDVSQTRNLLNLEASSSLPFTVKGTTDLMIIDEAANSLDEVFAGLQFVINIKKEQCGVKERCQILLELVAADLKSEKRCAPVGLLTNLNNYWYFLWFTPGREIARMRLRCPANGFKMMKELLNETNSASAGVFPMRIPFLHLPLPKRQKLLEAAPAGEDAATEMLERYELMSDELSPEFLLARRMEYEFRKVREMPIHSGMYA